MKKIAALLLFAVTIFWLSGCDSTDCQVQEIVVGDLPTATTNNYFEHYISYTRNCSPASEQWYSLSSLPPGLQFSSNGKLSGKPTKAGEYDITVEIECFFEEEYDSYDNPVYTDRSAVSTTFTLVVHDTIPRM